MGSLNCTAVMLACVALFLIVWNVVFTSLWGNAYSISYTLAELNKHNPWIVIILSILLGHCFWNVPPK